MRNLDTRNRCHVLVTGGDGFVGRWLVSVLRADPAVGRVVAARQSPINGDPDTVEFDIRDSVKVGATLRDLRPSVVVHLAAVAAPQAARANVSHAWSVNLDGTRVLVEAILREVRSARFVFVSTSEVYGGTFKIEPTPVDEDARLDPLNPYAATKAAADLMVGQMARDGLAAVRMRPFNHTGPGQDEAFVVSAFATQIARIEAGRQEPVLRVGNLDARRDFLDVRDVVDAYRRVILAPSDALPPGTIFNVASGMPRRVGQILHDLLALSRVEIRVEIDESRLRGADVPCAVGASDRIRNMLGWVPSIPWSTTLSDVMNTCREKLVPDNIIEK